MEELKESCETRSVSGPLDVRREWGAFMSDRVKEVRRVDRVAMTVDRHHVSE
jgi:hypothetical protein